MSCLDHGSHRQDPLWAPAYWAEPDTPLQADTLIDHGICRKAPAPPPSPKVFPQGGFSHDAIPNNKFLSLDEWVFRPTPTPLRRVLSINDEDEEPEEDLCEVVDAIGDETATFIYSDSDNRWICLWQDCFQTFGTKQDAKSHLQAHLYARHYDEFNDDITTIVTASGLPSSRCSYVGTLSNEAPRSRKRFTIRSRTRKEHITSDSYKNASVAESSVSDRQFSSPILSSSIVTPNIVPSTIELAPSSVQTWPRRGSYCPSGETPPISHQEEMETSHWSDDEKVDSSRFALLASFPGRGRKPKSRRSLSDAFCGLRFGL